MRTLGKALFFVLMILIFFAGCRKKDVTLNIPEFSTMTDIDGNTYQIIKIGNQWWMAENLRVKHYRNGASIPQMTVTDPDTSWANATTGAYCKYFFDDNIAAKYGLLYNYYSITDTNSIAPAGWHVPSDEEWKEMERALGMSAAAADQSNWRGTDEGGKMKTPSPGDWTTYSTLWSTGESGFSARPGCCRLFDGRWGDPGVGSMGFWWTSSAHASDNQAWFRYLDYKDARVYRYHVAKTYGMSIRCVKD